MKSEAYTVLENCKASHYIDVWTNHPFEPRWGFKKINLDDGTQQLWIVRGVFTSMGSQDGITPDNNISMLKYRPIDTPITNEAKQERHGEHSKRRSSPTLWQHLMAMVHRGKLQS